MSVDYDALTGAPTQIEFDGYDGTAGPVTLLIGAVTENLPA